MNQAELSASFFQQYFADEDLAAQARRLLSGFSQNTSAQVQIISASGQLLQDSTGVQSGGKNGGAGVWNGREPSTQEPVLAISYPLQAKDMTVGAVRFATSLTETAKTVRQISAIFIFVGLMVIALVAALSFFLSRTITSSITELKRAAEKMADGDYNGECSIKEAATRPGAVWDFPFRRKSSVCIKGS